MSTVDDWMKYRTARKIEYLCARSCACDAQCITTYTNAYLCRITKFNWRKWGLLFLRSCKHTHTVIEILWRTSAPRNTHIHTQTHQIYEFFIVVVIVVVVVIVTAAVLPFLRNLINLCVSFNGSCRWINSNVFLDANINAVAITKIAANLNIYLEKYNHSHKQTKIKGMPKRLYSMFYYLSHLHSVA